MMKVSGICFTSLIEGKVQLGMVHDTQRESLLEELYLRGIVTDPKDQIKNLKEKLARTEHPNDGDIWKQQKFFKLKLLTAPEWSRDLVQAMLDTFLLFRSIRVEEE